LAVLVEPVDIQLAPMEMVSIGVERETCVRHAPSIITHQPIHEHYL
jgi:hypothetical protein